MRDPNDMRDLNEARNPNDVEVITDDKTVVQRGNDDDTVGQRGVANRHGILSKT